jgi:hypothetical protein
MRDKWMMMPKKPKKKVCLLAPGVLSTHHGKIPETLLVEEMPQGHDLRFILSLFDHLICSCLGFSYVFRKSGRGRMVPGESGIVSCTLFWLKIYYDNTTDATWF